MDYCGSVCTDAGHRSCLLALGYEDLDSIDRCAARSSLS